MKAREPELRTVSVKNFDIDYLYYHGGERTIVFLHATGFMPWLWHPIARELAGEYTIVAPFFCDHRSSEPEDGGLHWKVLAEDFAAFCQAINLSEPFLVGHSMGGTIITIANVLFNTAAAKMIIIEPIFLPEEVYTINLSVEQHPLASKSIKRKNFWESEEEACDYLKSKGLFGKWDPEMLELYIKYGMMEQKNGGLELVCHPRKEASLFMGGIHYNPWSLLEQMQSPVMVIEGEESENRSFIDLQKAASMIPNGEYHMVRGAGHLIPMEKPGEIERIIAKYFS